MSDDEPAPRVRKGNRAHKLRRRRKVEDNPMSGGSLRRVYPAALHRRLTMIKKSADDDRSRPT